MIPGMVLLGIAAYMIIRKSDAQLQAAIHIYGQRQRRYIPSNTSEEADVEVVDDDSTANEMSSLHSFEVDDGFEAP